MPHANATQSGPRVLLIGWDGADWIVLNQLLDAGRMPNLSRFVEAGVIGNLASLSPCLTPMLWTSAATGKLASEHGILGFVEPRADGLGAVPSRSSSRTCKALWNILDQSGKRSCVVAWPVSDPVEPIAGVYVSERMTDGLADRLDAIGPAPSGCVHPATLEPFVSELRLHPCELAPEDLHSMIPEIASIDLEHDNRPEHLARLFARCSSVHSVATAAMTVEPWDFFAVYYETLDRAGHDFMAYRAPRMEHIGEQDFQHYRHVMDGLYEFHDAMLGSLMQLAGEDTTIVLMSDHGFQSGNRRPATLGRPGTIPAEGADWHRMLGVLAMKGPGVKRDERIYGASLLDIAPTVLSLFGLPGGRDMKGRVLTGAFVEAPEICWTESWEADPKASRVADVPASAAGLNLEAREAGMRQLAALGYIAAEAVEGAQAARAAEREAHFNLATVHLNHGRPETALLLFQRLCEQAAGDMRYQHSRLLALSRLTRHREVLEEIERMEAAGTASARLDLLAAAALAASGRATEALDRMRRAAEREPANPIVHQVAGDYQLARGRLQEAEECYAQSIALDPDNAPSHCGMAQVKLELGKFEEAAENALASLQQAFWNPVAQFRLGQAMAGLGNGNEARRAFENALEQAPSYGEAHARLATMFEEDGDYLRAMVHRQRSIGIVTKLSSE